MFTCHQFLENKEMIYMPKLEGPPPRTSHVIHVSVLVEDLIFWFTIRSYIGFSQEKTLLQGFKCKYLWNTGDTGERRMSANKGHPMKPSTPENTWSLIPQGTQETAKHISKNYSSS